MTYTFRSLAALAALTMLAAGCGGSSAKPNADRSKAAIPVSAKLRSELRAATASTETDFPSVGGRTMRRLAASITSTGTQVGLASSDFVPGENRLAFGVIDENNTFIYAKTGVYVADGVDQPARGPYPAPADLLVTEPAFRSQTAATEKDPFAAVYEAQVQLTMPGKTLVLVVSKLDDGTTVGATAQITVRAKDKDPVVSVGQQAPKVTTDTVASAAGDLKSIDTRRPTDDMHKANFADVVGKKPVALLFATPQLCQSRVCGPVVDIADQLKSVYGDRMTFIHQEVYRDNDVSKGLRPPLQTFGLETEPWLFVMNAQGKVTARLEGSFGFTAMNTAIKTGLS